MTKLPKDIEEKFDNEFEGYGGEYSSNIDAPRSMIKSFIATILEEERENIINKIENQVTSDIAFLESVNQKIRYQSYKELIINAIRQLQL